MPQNRFECVSEMLRGSLAFFELGLGLGGAVCESVLVKGLKRYDLMCAGQKLKQPGFLGLFFENDVRTT